MSIDITVSLDPVQHELSGDITVTAGNIDHNYSLSLVGRGATNYGQEFANNTIKLLTNFASDNAPASRYTLKGQLWFDAKNDALKVYNGEKWNILYSGSGGSATIVQPEDGGTGLNTKGQEGKFLKVNASGTGYIFVDADDITGGVDSFLMAKKSSGPNVDNAYNLGSPSKRFRTVHSAEFVGVATSARFADLAERYESDVPLQSGDVVMIGGEKEITKVVGENSLDVFGVISTNPGMKLNADAGDDSTHPYVALAGRVPVKVIGVAKKGQLLVASTIDGVAKAVNSIEVTSSRQIIGRVLEDKTSAEIGLIEAVVGVK